MISQLCPSKGIGLVPGSAFFLVVKCLQQHQALHVQKSRCVAEKRTLLYSWLLSYKDSEDLFSAIPSKILSNFILINYVHFGTWAPWPAEGHLLIDLGLGHLTIHCGISLRSSSPMLEAVWWITLTVEESTPTWKLGYYEYEEKPECLVVTNIDYYTKMDIVCIKFSLSFVFL